MARYIDADKFNKKKKYLFQIQGMPFPKSEWFIKADDLYSAPTADVVEVVRCENCLNWNVLDPAGNGGWCEKMDNGTSYNDFCSYGERREANDN